jgi:hypothetical protein
MNCKWSGKEVVSDLRNCSSYWPEVLRKTTKHLSKDMDVWNKDATGRQ